MTPEQLADITARAYRHMKPWTAAQYAETLASPHALLTHVPGAFALGFVVADDMAEIAALACDPDRQRQGLASQVLTAFCEQASARGAARVILEVSAENTSAIGFYTKHAFAEAGRRKAYYRQPDGTRVDALVMTRALP